jgi:GH25 family lysozyme M1 (1,4-beta-N-acetylmuramidase)
MNISDDTIRFIDISKWQRPEALHWHLLPTDVRAVASRATYGTKPDPLFGVHVDATVDAARQVGAYHFVTDAPAADQFKAFEAALAAVKFGDPDDLLPILDVEWMPGDKRPRPGTLDTVNAMIDLVSRKWGGVILYSPTGFWQQLGSPRAWLAHPWWVPHYPADRSEKGARAFASRVYAPHGLGNWQMWQSGPRDLPGFCASPVDYNYSSIPLPTLAKKGTP